MTHRSYWTTAGEWYSHLANTCKLLELLNLELKVGQVETLRQRYSVTQRVRLKEPRRGTAPFYFALSKLLGVGKRRVLFINRLCRLVLKARRALLVCFVKANLVDVRYQHDVREQQQRRINNGDQNNFKFRVVITAVTNINVKRATGAICDYLN